MDKDKQSIELLLRTPQEVMLDCAARVRGFPLLLCWDGLRSLTGCLLYPQSRSRFSILKSQKSDRGHVENEAFRLSEYLWHPPDGRSAL